MLRKYLNRKNDHAISPVIGTILMIAATVIIAGAVYAAVNIYGGKNAKQTVDASWKSQALDTSGDGLDDTIKVTYVNGPTGVAGSAITVTAKDAAGNTLAQQTTTPSSWDPGAYLTFVRCTGAAAPSAACVGNQPAPLTVYVTVAQSGTSMLDQQFSLKQ